MSTDYLVKEPTTLTGLEAMAAEIGWGATTMHDPGPNGPVPTRVLTDGSNYVRDLVEAKCTDGETRVTFTRYGLNNEDELVEHLDCWSEHDDEFMNLLYGDEDD